MRNSSILLCVFIGCLLGVDLGQAWFGSSNSIEKNYDTINNYLAESVNDIDLEKNFAKAEDWLAELESKQKSCFRSCDGSLVEAVRQFVRLRTVLNPEKCNKEGYDILKANYDAAGKPSIWYYIRYANERRIDYIVRQCAKTHSEMCWNVYPDLVATRFERELKLWSKLYISNLAEFLPIPWDQEKMFGEKLYVQPIIEFLQKDPEDKEKAASMKDGTDERRKLKRYDFIEYVLNPCVDLDQKISSEFLEATEFDLALQGRDMEQYNAGPGKQRELLKIRSAMILCRRVVEKDAAIWNHIAELVGVENMSSSGFDLSLQQVYDTSSGGDDDDDD